MKPDEIACSHLACVAQPGEACGTFNLEDRSRTPFLIDGQPAFHAERIASAAYWSAGGKGEVTAEEFAQALEADGEL